MLQLWAVSDLHTDYAANLAWVRSLPDRRGRGAALCSVLLVAGDVSDDLRLLRCAALRGGVA